MLMRRVVSGIDVDEIALTGTNITLNGFFDWPPLENHPGQLMGVLIRNAADGSGAGTLANLQVKVISRRHQSPLPTTVAAAVGEALCFDSGVIAAPASSATALAQAAALFGGGGGDPQPYSLGLRVLYTVAIVGTLGARSLKIGLLIGQDD